MKTCKSIPPEGDAGQRYEHLCDEAQGNTRVMGWSNDPEGSFADCVKKHPSWTNHRAVDRWTNKKPGETDES